MTLSPCLYCQQIEVPRTREHVLQAAFGASATLPSEVCAECNSAFSPLDKAFLEAVQFYHLGENMLRGLGLGRAVLQDGTAVNARHRADGNGEFLPQLYEVTPTEWRFLGHRESDFHTMLRELAEPAALQIKCEAVRPDEGTPRLTIVRSAPGVYLIQGSSADLLERFAGQCRSNGFRPDWCGEPFEHSSHESPAIKFDTSLALEPFSRAMAKVALNFVCYRLGAAIAGRPEFDAVRRYARYGDGHFADFVVPTVLNHTLGDCLAGFVTPEHRAALYLMGSTADGNREAVFLGIGGKTVGRVDITRDRSGLPPGTWLLTRFHKAQGGVEDLTLPDDMPRALLNPEVFGLQDIWPLGGARR